MRRRYGKIQDTFVCVFSHRWRAGRCRRTDLEQLNLLWDYQVIELEAETYENNLRASDDYKQYAKLHKFLEEQKRILQRLNGSVEEKKERLARGQERYDLLYKRYQDGLEKFEKVDQDNLKEVERFKTYFEQLEHRLNQERLEWQKMVKELESEEELLDKMKGKLAKASKEYTAVQERLADQRESFHGEVDALEIQAKKISEKIDPALMSRYKSVKKSYPTALVDVRKNRCTGCNMELSVGLLRRLRENEGIVECENCGRILRLGAEEDEAK